VSALLLLGAVLLAAQPVAAQEDEIVVIGRLVERVQLTLGRDQAGRVTCSLDRSSGNTRVDKAVCRRASRCMPRGRTDRRRIEACIADSRRWVVAQWRRARR
jgi:hypothetical protein